MPTYSSEVGSAGTSATIDLYLVITEASFSDKTNSSVIQYTPYLRKRGTAGSPFRNAADSNCTVIIDGVTRRNANYSYNFPTGNDGYQVALGGTGSVTINHTSNGTKTLTGSASFTGGGGTPLSNGSVGFSLALTPTARPINIKPDDTWLVGLAWVKDEFGVWKKTNPWAKDGSTWKLPA